MTAKTTSSSKKLKSRTVRKKGWLERSPLGGFAKNTSNNIRDLRKSITGVVFGTIFLLIGFLLIWGSVRWVKNYAAVVESLSFTNPAEVESDAGLVKLKGTPEVTDIEFSYVKCGDRECGILDQEQVTRDDVMYYSATYERYEQYKEVSTETKTIDRGGEEVTEEYEVTEIKEDWKTVSSESNWADLQLGDVKIYPEKAKNKVEKETQTIENVVLPSTDDGDTYYVPGRREEASSKVGETRLVLQTIGTGDELIVVGEVSGGDMRDGEPFVITDKSHEKLLESLKTDEKTGRLMLRIGSWVLLTLGFMLVIGPVLALADFIPVVGGVAKFLAFITSAIISVIIIAIGVLVVKYWWIVLILVSALIGGGIYLVMRKSPKK